MVVNNHKEFRQKVVKNIEKFLGDKKISINIEKGIYNYTIKQCDEFNLVKKWENQYFIKIYIYKFKNIYFNLKNNNIIEKLKNKTIKSYKFAEITQQELFPEKWKPILEDLKIKNENKYIPKIQASTDDFECYKCKSIEISSANKEKRKPLRENYTQCTYYQLQTRSADEPMTTFVTCIKCGTRFKC